MKILRYLSYVLLSLIVLFIVLAFVLPIEQQITTSKTIDGPQLMVFNAINDLRAQEDWSPFKDADPTMDWTMGDKLVGKGASYTWTSENQGDGSYRIVESNLETGIKTEVKFGEKRGGKGTISLNPNGESTEVNWTFEFKAGRFTNVLMPILKVGMKNTFKKGLENLDALIKTRKNEGEYYGYSINQEVIPLKYYATKRSEVSQDKVQQFYASNLGYLFTSIQNAGAEMSGKPSGLIYNFKPQESKVDIAAGIPISDEVNLEEVPLETIEAGKAAQLDFYGDYSDIPIAHAAIQAYLSDRELIHNWPIIEEYVTDPSVEKDPAKWLTVISYPIAN